MEQVKLTAEYVAISQTGFNFPTVNSSSVTLSRDCEAIQIPVGTAVTLKQGTSVDIAQTLGGSFTIHCLGGLYRIAGKDADALGLPVDASATAESNPPSGPLEEKHVWDALRSCYDPEIPVNIVDLGLIYDLRIDPDEDGDSSVLVKMTLTAPGCGMGASIAADAQQKILALPGVEEATVEVVWDPPWHQSMITPAGRKALGIE